MVSEQWRVRVDAETATKARRFCATEDRTLSWLVNAALAAYLRTERPPIDMPAPKQVSRR